MKIRIATRRSELALWQARHVADLLNALPDIEQTKLLPMSTKGDEILDRSLQKIGGKGLFIKELEQAMLNGDADVAVHSMKDVPAELPPRFCIAATLARANSADVLVSRNGRQLSELRPGCRIGTSSLRRQAQVRMLRPDARIVPLRGNVNTRLQKLEHGRYDAIVLAAAGLERLGLAHYVHQQFEPEEMLPATAQGVLGIECRSDNGPLRDILAALNDDAAARTTSAERRIASALNAGCQSPVAAYAEVRAGELHLTALIAHPDGSPALRESIRGDAGDPEALGTELAARLQQMGATELLASIEAQYG